MVASATADPGVEIAGLRRLSGGASRETWAFDAAHGDGRITPLILRRDPPGAPKAGMAIEAALMRAAAREGVPVPEVLAADESSLIMDRVEGETIPRRILRDAAYASARPRLAGECGRILAAIHRIPPAAVPGLVGGDPVAQWRDQLDGLGQPHPALELGLRWLDAHRPPARREVVVHGDFRNGNLIVGADGIRAVLDWELAHLGDPVEDLGWLCVKAWRFGVDQPVGGFGAYGELLDAYEDESGIRVSAEELRWWEVLGTLRWGVICILQATVHTSGLLRSVELAAIGRRVCENEWDLLALLPTGWP